MIPEQQRQLETLASLIAIALERVHFVDISQDMLVRMEAERLRNSMLAAISHDLRTPLTALTGFADALLLKPLPAGKLEFMVHAIRESAKRMHTLVNNLLDMARIQSGKLSLRKDWNSLEEMVGSAIRSLEPLLDTHQVVTHIPPDLPLVECDAVLIERVLANLLENAVKYTPVGSTIEIFSSIASETQLQVSVNDHGPGFAADMKEHLFEKFTRGEAESATSGVGLGLAICKTIIEAHGGGISAHNRQNTQGASFVFTLPLTEQPVIATETDIEDQ